ncbi:MAG: GntR family transcriptional regulator [Planctomycetaceae bacterium]
MSGPQLSNSRPRHDLVDRRRLSDYVADQIREHIVQNRLQPGDRLPTEHALAERFGVSRVSVREATKALGFLGLLHSSPRRGTTVGELNLRRITPYLELHPTLRDASAEQLIDARAVIELGVLPRLMERMQSSRQIYQQLQEMVDRSQSVSELQGWIVLDINFHMLLVDLSGMTPLIIFHDLLEVFFTRFRKNALQAELASDVLEIARRASVSHQRLIDFLHHGKLQEATEELRAHIQSHNPRP